MKVVYLASPYSHKTKRVEKLRMEAIDAIAAELHIQYKNIAFILPITTSCAMRKQRSSLGGAFEEWAKRDYEFLKRSDELWVVMLPGWLISVGVLAEIKFMEKQKNKKIRYLDPYTLKFNKKRGLR